MQIPTYRVGRYANVRSKIDQSDPNPAHKLQHSVEDLTIDSKQGREINPRFSSSRFASRRPGFHRGKTIDFSDRFPRNSSPVDYHYKRAASVDSPLGPIQSRPASTFPLRKERASKLTRMSRVLQEAKSSDSFEEAEEDELLSGARVGSELDQGERNSTAFTALIEEEEVAPMTTSGPGGNWISGMEVTSNGSETTVVLKHILALSRKQSTDSNTDMTIIEEDELEEEKQYYESQDSPLSPASTGSSFQLPHPIPRLIVTTEEGELVETVVEKVRSYLSVSEEDQEELEHTVLSTHL